MAETLMCVLFVCLVTVLTGVFDGTSAQSNPQTRVHSQVCSVVCKMAETLTCRLFVCLVTVLTGVLDGTSAQSNPQNVALNKQCDISTMYNGSGFSNPCGAANNGNTGTVYVNGNCIHTNTWDARPEWTVYLGQDYVIHSITIYARGIEVQRMSDVNVTINNNVVKTFPMCIPSEQNNCDFTAGRFDIMVSPPVIGNTVTLEGPAHGGGGGGDNIHFLNICEVQVWAYVCASGNYPSGDACVPCGQCADGDCSHLTGHCSTDCEPGYTGLPFCQTECDHRHFGYSCSESCSAGCDGETCDNMSGHCDVTTCLPGYFQTPPCDTECDRHHYGTNCSHHCSAGCEGQTCDGATGHCDVSTCRPGYLQSPRCDQECPDGTYGTNCSQPCGQGCDPPDSCNKTNGGCACLSANWGTRRCADCSDGHYGPDCDQTCGHCAHSEVCSKTDGRCPAACDGDYTPPYCKPLQQQPHGPMVAEVAAGVAGAAVFLVIVVVVVVVLVRKRKSGSTQHHSQPTPKDSGPGFTESNVDLAIPTRGSASTTHAVGVTAAAQRDDDTEEHYVTIDDVTPASHETQYYNTDGSNPQYHHTEGPSTGHYDQLAVQYENTGDVRPYQQWSVSREGQHGSHTRTA